jgi:hypothetical protein
MKMTIDQARIAAAVLALSALLAACAPAAREVGGPALPPTAASTSDSAYVDDLMPIATPDPAPQQTTVSGEHRDVIGTVTSLTAATIDVDGVTYGLTPATEVKGSLAVGEKVKLEYVTNPNGSRTVIEAKGPGFFDDSGGSSDD